MTRRRKLLIGGALVLALSAGGVGYAQAGGDDDENVTGPDADRAKQAAVAVAGGGRAVGVEREDEGSAAWASSASRGTARRTITPMAKTAIAITSATPDDLPDAKAAPSAAAQATATLQADESAGTSDTPARRQHHDVGDRERDLGRGACDRAARRTVIRHERERQDRRHDERARVGEE